MNDHTSFSNMAGGATPRVRVSSPASDAAAPERGAPDFVVSLGSWKQGLLAWIGALGSYAREVGDSGARALGTRWSAATRAVASVGDAVAAVGDPASLRALMDAGDALERATHQLESAAATYLDSNVQAAITAGLSRTYSDSFKRLARAVHSAGAEVKTAQRLALNSAGRAGGESAASLTDEDVEQAFLSSQTRGGIATELYTGALLCSRSGRAAHLLESAKDTALACRDSRESARADAEALGEYHPLQAMGYAASPPAPAREAGPADAALDLTLPTAHLSVTFNLAALTDRRAGGPPGSMFSGLNYKLVERMRSIAAEGLRPGAAEGARPGLAAGPVLVTTDRGRTVRELGAAGFAPAAEWAPCAGARPRVGAYSEAAAALILDRLRAERDEGWDPELRARYEAAVESGGLPSGECGPSLLVDALVAELERAYDADPPEGPGDFHKLAVPEEPSPGDYITAAVARAGSDAADAGLRRLLAAPVQRVPYAAVEREARTLQAINTVDAARGVWLSLRKGLRTDAEAFSLPAPRRKVALMLAYRRSVESIVSAAPVYCAPPSFKLYAAAAVARVAEF